MTRLALAVLAVKHLFRKRYWLCNDSFFGVCQWVVVSRMPWEPYCFGTLPVTVRPWNPESNRRDTCDERLAVLDPEDVLPYAGPGSPPKCYADPKGRKWSVRMRSRRYGMFRRSMSCACCGITGNVMILERHLGVGTPTRVRQPHFNLYSASPDGLTLMTRDHILPKSKGGKDTLDNYQTMCEPCNMLKGSDLVDMEIVRERRRQYDEHPRKRVKKNPPNTRELIISISDEHRVTFWSNIQRTDGCWAWIGPTPKRGFPRFSIKRQHGVCSIDFALSGTTRCHHRKSVRAYQAAYYLDTGDFLQRGWPVCRNRLCCNPDHMGSEDGDL